MIEELKLREIKNWIYVKNNWKKRIYSIIIYSYIKYSSIQLLIIGWMFESWKTVNYLSLDIYDYMQKN